MGDNTYSSIKGSDGYYLVPKSGKIHFIKSIDGRLIKFSCRTDSLRKAKTYANKKLKDILRTGNTVVSPLLGFWIDKYIAERSRETELSHYAIHNSVNALKQARPFWKNMLPVEVDKTRWLEFCDWYKNETGNQLDNVFKYFKHFLGWLSEEKHCGKYVLFKAPVIKNPDSKITRKRRKKEKSRILTEAEFRAIYSSCSEMEQLLLLLMYTMAFRVESDALSAKWSQFELDSDVPVYIFGEFDNKAGLEGRQAIHPEVLPRLIKWKVCNSSTEFVFPQKNDPTKHLARGAIDWPRIRYRSGVHWGWTSHTLRHTCLTNLADAQYPMHLICKCYRISPQEFMNTYAHLTQQGLEKMREAIKVKL